MDQHSRIVKYIELANASGKRFAFKNQKYEPECQAEARFILTYTILEESELLDKAHNEQVFLKIVIARRLRNYFRNKQFTEQVGIHPKQGQMLGEFKEDPTNEIEIVDAIETLFPGQRDLIELWRKGFTLEDMMFLNPSSVRVVRDMVKVRQTLRRSKKALQKRMEKLCLESSS